MINKVIFSTIFFCLLVAISLHLAGVQQVNLGSEFMSFMRTCSFDLKNFKIEIPNIPYIPQIEEADTGLLDAVNNVVSFLNGLVDLLNFIVMILNVLIQLIEFIIIVLRNLITMKDNLISNSSSVVQQLLNV